MNPFKWTSGKYSFSYCTLAGIPMGSVGWSTTRDDKTPHVARAKFSETDRKFASEAAAHAWVESEARAFIEKLSGALNGGAR